MGKRQYESFSLNLALFDAIPVIFFCAAMFLIAFRFDSLLFSIGSICCIAAGLVKVIWKIILSAAKKDIHILNIQLRALMPTGFLLIIVGLFSGMNPESWKTLGEYIASFPSCILFCITFVGMILMGIFAWKLDGTKARSNWIEQITNAVAQGCFFLGVWFCIY